MSRAADEAWRASVIRAAARSADPDVQRLLERRYHHQQAGQDDRAEDVVTRLGEALGMTRETR